MSRLRLRRLYLIADAVMLAWCGSIAVLEVLYGTLGWSLVYWACFAGAAFDGVRQARILREAAR